MIPQKSAGDANKHSINKKILKKIPPMYKCLLMGLLSKSASFYVYGSDNRA
jgi:hypothetical protein